LRNKLLENYKKQGNECQGNTVFGLDGLKIHTGLKREIIETPPPGRDSVVGLAGMKLFQGLSQTFLQRNTLSKNFIIEPG